jgi:hypothetical protein
MLPDHAALDAVLAQTAKILTRGKSRRANTTNKSRKQSVPCWDGNTSLLDAVLAQTIKNLIATQPVEEAAQQYIPRHSPCRGIALRARGRFRPI